MSTLSENEILSLEDLDDLRLISIAGSVLTEVFRRGVEDFVQFGTEREDNSVH